MLIACQSDRKLRESCAYLFGPKLQVKGTGAIDIIEGGSPEIEILRLSSALTNMYTGREMTVPSTRPLFVSVKS